MRRFAVPLLAALALLASLAGCGSKSSGSGLDTALDYVPKGAPFVIAIDTNPDGGQWQQVNHLIAKFPFGGQVKGQFKNAFNARSGIDYDKDIKPLLGNDLVVAITGSSSSGGKTPYVLAWKVKDEAAAKRLIQSRPTNLAVVKDGVLVAAESKPALDTALNRAGGSDHMTEQDFTDALGGLPSDSLMRATGNFQALLTGPQAAAARKVKWLNALRTFGVALRAEPDGIEYAFKLKTDSGSLSPNELPLAAGALSPPVVKRAGEIGFGIRNPAQIVTFAQQVAQITNPTGYGKYVRDKAKLSRQLGVDIDRDLIGQLTGNASISVGLSGAVALRADVRDPAAASKTLKKVAPRLVKIAKSRGKTAALSAPKNGQGFYALAEPNGKKIAFGVVGKSFILATDAARAAQFAGESPSAVPGAKGSLVISSDARSLANAIAAQRGQGVAAQIVTGALGDLVGSVESETGAITGNLKLQIK
ncbi:MAG: hypothetical protein QOF65_1972 [Thermoleophilaceae bacterium]|nr:hypothetical protein [Thermoleophilaceae bacterium]